jgi:2-polyprenyl-3-methyl-5-hydroxy-6-metoxy-1,4-benzoquinol methylase
MTTAIERLCWCGDSQFVDFSDDYRRCARCGTLVSQAGLSPEDLLVRDDEHDFYGKEYWLSHQRQDLANPDIYQRARADLPERCLYWLRTLLTYKLPPGRVLELGSAHGGFVALMRWAGFDAMGLEMSPWVVEFARQTFDVPMLLGLLEEQQLPNASFDAIVLYDVLEHLDHPISTMRRCTELLKPDGVIIVQTPCYPENKTYAELLGQHDPFLAHIDKKANQHLYLFSQRAAQQLFECLGLSEVCFEPALFGYDIYFIASKTTITPTDLDHRSEVLTSSPPARLIQAMIDQDDRILALKHKINEVERDRLSRIDTIAKLNQHIERTRAAYEARLQVITDQQAHIAQLNDRMQRTRNDYEERLRVILDQQAIIARQQASLVDRQTVIDGQKATISGQQATISGQQATISGQQATISGQQATISGQQATLNAINQNKFVRILRYLRLLSA